MLKGLIILASGFEDTEALTTVDVLNRSGIDVTTMSMDDKYVVSQTGHLVGVDLTYSQVKLDNYDFLIIPGGKAVFNVLNKEERVDTIIDYFYNKKKLICAICAAPLLLAKRGYFKDLNFTVFPGCIDFNYLGTNTKSEVVVEDKIITARSMYYSIDFALAIIEKLQGTEQKNKVLNSLKGLY